jgi:hypothetical protein
MSPIKTETFGRRKTLSFRLGLIALVVAIFGRGLPASAVEVVVSVPEQKLYVFDAAGEKIRNYRISTAARFGDQRGTYATPLGKLEIANKIGEGAIIGTVFKGGRKTNEVCPINAKGRDPIVTRILHLRGTEAQNAAAYSRCIYIHGTPDERHLGKPVSYGCIRMASADVVELFDMVDVGTQIEITQERVTNMFGTIARRPVPIQAIASASSKSPAVAAVSAKVPGEAAKPTWTPGPAPLLASQIKPSESAKNVTGSRASTGHVKLLETSGLTINFGGSFENSDRPR